MSIYEDDIIILLRKIVAISMPNSFEATDDTNRKTLLEKLEAEDVDFFKIINDFIISFESREFTRTDYQLKLKAHDIWKSQYELFNKTLDINKDSLVVSCKQKHIDISYELSKILDDDEISE